MYEKIVGYFERKLCIENIYFRKNYLLWFIGITTMLIMEIIINKVIDILVNNTWKSFAISLVADFFITGIAVIFIYVIPMIKIYKQKVKIEISFDFLGFLMNEELLSAYREIEIEEMEHFLRRECKIKSTDSIKTIIEVINEEIRDKYEKKNFIEKYFTTIILPLLVLVLTVYLTNNNEQELIGIILTTIISVFSIVITSFLIFKIRNIKITPVNKRQNLLELKRVLTDILINWAKKYN